jgi:hypothetical protein
MYQKTWYLQSKRLDLRGLKNVLFSYKLPLKYTLFLQQTLQKVWRLLYHFTYTVQQSNTQIFNNISRSLLKLVTVQIWCDIYLLEAKIFFSSAIPISKTYPVLKNCWGHQNSVPKAELHSPIVRLHVATTAMLPRWQDEVALNLWSRTQARRGLNYKIILEVYTCTMKPHIRFHLEVADLNTKLRKILNGGNLILALLTLDYWNWLLNEGEP